MLGGGEWRYLQSSIQLSSIRAKGKMYGEGGAKRRVCRLNVVGPHVQKQAGVSMGALAF